MLTTLRHIARRALQRRSGHLLLALLAALWLALPLSADSAAPPPMNTAAELAQGGDHCPHHSADTDTGAHHHGDNHTCHCAQACHASPVALTDQNAAAVPGGRQPMPIHQPHAFASTSRIPLYRPPILLAA
jgi:hypothetical protein